MKKSKNILELDHKKSIFCLLMVDLKTSEKVEIY